MAILCRIISVGGETAGFVLPVFRAFRGANQELVQRIDEHNHIVALEPIRANNEEVGTLDENYEVRVGGRALWVFRDQVGDLHLGDAEELRTRGRQWLSSGSLNECPMAAAEMAAFCSAEVGYPRVLMSAFKALEQLSKRGAEIWRDSVVLLPLIKKDLEQQTLPLFREGIKLFSVFAITRDETTHIYVPAEFLPKTVKLTKSREVAEIFGIRGFQIHPTFDGLKTKVDGPPTWSFFGIGGIARFVIERPPFYGSSTNPDAPRGGAIAHGKLTDLEADSSYGDRLIVAAVTSDAEVARSANRFLRGLSTGGTRKHAINIRPIGFGTPRGDKLSPEAIRNILRDFDCVWIIANQRQRQTGNYANSLSASNVASRFVRTASSGLILCLRSSEGRDILREAERKRGFGLVGAALYSASLKRCDLIVRVLYTMLCEDANLHTASRIFMIFPYSIEENGRRETVALGNHRYEVDCITAPTPRHREVLAFATNVELSDHSERTFSDFCLSLVAGYGWTLRHDSGRSLLLENEGAVLRIWPVISTRATQALLIRDAEYGPDGDLIISNQTIRAAIHSEAEARGWRIAHYSELGRWMKAEFQVGISKDF